MSHGPILLEYKFNTGDTLRYKSTIETKQETTQDNKTNVMENKIELTYKWHIAEFLNDIYKLEIFIESGTLTQDNAVQNMPGGEKPIFSSLKKSGEIISEGAQKQLSQQALPSHPINIGEAWKSQEQLNLPDRPEPVIITHNNTFEKIENINGLECAYIKIECPSSKFELKSGVTLSLEVNGDLYFALKEGFPVKSRFKTISKLIAPQMQQSGERTMSMNLVEVNGKSLLA